MKPGRELDALVAEKVLGCHLERYQDALRPRENITCGCRPRKHGDMLNLWPYSTNIEAAWLVVEEMHGRGLTVQIIAGEQFFHCDIAPHPAESGVIASESADTAPHAICLAALKAVGHEVKI